MSGVWVDRSIFLLRGPGMPGMWVRRGARFPARGHCAIATTFLCLLCERPFSGVAPTATSVAIASPRERPHRVTTLPSCLLTRVGLDPLTQTLSPSQPPIRGVFLSASLSAASRGKWAKVDRGQFKAGIGRVVEGMVTGERGLTRWRLQRRE